jgi:hypothetical protein
MRNVLISASVLVMYLGNVGLPDRAALAQPTDDAQKKLEVLRKSLPEAIDRGVKKGAGYGVPEDKLRVQLLRRLSADEAKLTVVLFDESIFVFYLKYYDGSWTTTRYEAKCAGFMNGRENCAINIALAIDQIGEAK